MVGTFGNLAQPQGFIDLSQPHLAFKRLFMVLHRLPKSGIISCISFLSPLASTTPVQKTLSVSDNGNTTMYLLVDVDDIYY